MVWGFDIAQPPTLGCSVFPCQVREQPDGSLYVSLGGALRCLVESYWNHHGTVLVREVKIRNQVAVWQATLANR